MRIFRRVGASTAVGLFLMNADPLQEDGLTVQQNLLAFCLNGAETYLVADGFFAQLDFHLI